MCIEVEGARNKTVDNLQYGELAIEATTIVEDEKAAVDSEAVEEEESVEELVNWRPWHRHLS